MRHVHSGKKSKERAHTKVKLGEAKLKGDGSLHETLKRMLQQEAIEFSVYTVLFLFALCHHTCM